MEPSLEDRLAVASALILQSPPGEVNDVFNDLRPIVGDDNELETGLLPALSQYNTEQLTLVELPNAKMPAMICPAARLDTSSNQPEARYLDPNSQQTFIFDHLRLTASDVVKIKVEEDEPNEKIRLELNRETEGYVKSHYQDAFWSVFSTNCESTTKEAQVSSSNQDDEQKFNPITSIEDNKTQIESTDQSKISEDTSVDEESTHPYPLDRMVPDATEYNLPSDPAPSTQQLDKSMDDSEPPTQKFQLYIVGNKYNPSNYWTGRWRSRYEIDMNSSQIKGHIQVNVHYYEQGNVQLSTDYEPIIDLTSKDTTSTAKKASQIIKAIQQTESNYQNTLNSAYADLGDNTFKQLRRALPVTKQKINWNNIKSRIVLNDN